MEGKKSGNKDIIKKILISAGVVVLLLAVILVTAFFISFFSPGKKNGPDKAIAQPDLSVKDPRGSIRYTGIITNIRRQKPYWLAVENRAVEQGAPYKEIKLAIEEDKTKIAKFVLGSERDLNESSNQPIPLTQLSKGALVEVFSNGDTSNGILIASLILVHEQN